MFREKSMKSALSLLLIMDLTLTIAIFSLHLPKLILTPFQESIQCLEKYSKVWMCLRSLVIHMLTVNIGLR